MRAITSGVMPHPVSVMDSMACGKDVVSDAPSSSAPRITLPVSSVRRPPEGIASRAFTTRFINT